MKTKRKIRYGVVGLGYISQVALLPAFKHAKANSELAALVSSDSKKLKKLGSKYGVGDVYSYDQYDEFLKSGKVDAVYIGLPNNMHAEYAERAMRAGVHVLCEKPMAVSFEECERMNEAAAQSRSKLMIAYRLHFDPANLEAIKFAQSGKLGNLRIFSSVFSQEVRDADNIRLQKEKGGGSVFDMGIYCINAARYLFGAEPLEVFAYSVKGTDARFIEVDEMTSVMMRFPGDRLATFTSSFGASATSTYTIVGTKGKLRMTPAYEYAFPMTLEVTIKGKTRNKTVPKHDQFAAELIYFSDCILRDVNPEPSGIEGQADIAVIEAIYKSARSGRPAAVNAPHPAKRPTPAQEILKPAVHPPEVIDAESPSGAV